MSNRKKIINLFIIALTLWIIATIIKYPKNSINAAYSGLTTWINIVMPSLLPFFISSEILVSLGFANIIEKLLDPIMRPLFNVPGNGAFPFCMSITSGYPTGVRLVSTMRNKKLFSKDEGQRLISFCSTSGPLFMIGAVSTGMLKIPELSPLILLSHYLGALTVGLLFKHYKKDKKSKDIIKKPMENILGPTEKNENIGIIITTSMKKSIDSILLIGGFIIFYSVFIEMLEITKTLDFIVEIIIKIFPFISNKTLAKAFLTGLLEITIGCNNVATIKNVNLISKIVLISFLIGWSGLSIHLQAISFINTTDLNSKLYIFSKFIHGIFSSIYSYIIYKLFYNNITLPSISKTVPYIKTLSINTFLNSFKFATFQNIFILLFLLLISLILSLFHSS